MLIVLYRKEILILEFLEMYFTRCTATDKLTQAWPPLFELIKDALHHVPSSFLMLLRLVQVFTM